MSKILKFIIICHLIPSYFSFNLSPIPNIYFDRPAWNTQKVQTRSSYFGYSLNLRKTHVIIGAPRDQSTLEQQSQIDEPGSVYKCNFNSHNDQPCDPYHFDLFGNTRNTNFDREFNSEKKDYQMLGFTMDGLSTEDDRFVVCAPKLIGDYSEQDHYLLHGICYWVNETRSTQPSGVRQINPLRVRNKQHVKINGKEQYLYMYGESGFSVHITENQKEIIIGCPGIGNWRGSIIRYREGDTFGPGGLSRRDLGEKHVIRKRQTSFISDIPNPLKIDFSDDSYFGYAVSSAYFLGRENLTLSYVASAPQTKKQTGEVYIFDIDEYNEIVKILNKFSGTQFGEYFGYALLSEDFNADGFPDLAVSAPFYSKSGLYENGAVYVFMNRGNYAFDKPIVLTSDYEMNGRFGSSISKIGDVNLDGYNDLIVSAPYENDGTVYIYLGGQNGISTKPTQKLQAPSAFESAYGDKSAMFGMGLSRGVDIDNNGYNDIAIGSPNSEVVYVYKTYPVIKVISSIVSSKNELTLEDNTLAIKVCARFESASTIDREIEFNTTLLLDMQYNRASLSQRETEKVVSDSLMVTSEEKCNDYLIYIRGNLVNIFRPVTIDLKYDVVEKVSETDKNFCETCVVLDPRDLKMSSTKISFSTGCSGERCISDLSIVGTLINVRQPYVLGSTKTIAIKYEISNAGESAYLTQLKVTIPTNVTQFSKIPSNCRQESTAIDVMICDVNTGKPVKNSETTDITINLDASRLEGTSFKVYAEVSSAGDEQNPTDNQYVNEIFLSEFSDIELNGQSSAPQFSLEDGPRNENVQYRYKVFNNGPSTIKELSLVIQIPLIYMPKPNYHVNLVNFDEIEVRGFYINKVYEVTWNTENKNWIAHDAGAKRNDIIVDNFDSSKLGYDYDLNANRHEEFNELGQSHHRRRRNMWQKDNDDDNIYRVYNQLTGSIDEYHSSYRVSTDKEDPTLLNLPRNRTIFLDCSTSEENNECIEAHFIIHNFRPGSDPITITMNFTLDLTRFDDIFNEAQNIFVYKTNARFHRVGDEELRTLKVTTRNPYTIIYEKLTTRTPLWIWIVSIIVGILLLILMSYGLYRCGFFTRAHKDEIERLTRESRNISAEEADELKNLNA